MSPHPAMYCPNCGTQSSTARCPVCSFQLRAPDADWACLRTTSGEPVPLLGVALGGEVFGAHARLVLRQRYKNREVNPIEAVYTFPIPSDATLVGFAMECEGRRLEAEVKEREEAFATYDDAIAKGHGAALLEQERPNVFTASVGNLLPDEETIVEVTFLLKLTADEGALRLMIPTLVAPRYIPGSPAGDRTGHGQSAPTNVVPDADRITPKIASVRYGLAMDVLFDLGRDVTIESPSHRVVVTDEGAMRRRVTFAAQEVALDRDIILVAEGAPGVAAGLVCDKPAGEEGTFALTLVPDLFEAKKKSNGRAVVFVVDVSGSMGGASIEQAKRAMHLCLRHLSEGDLFDILPFSSAFSHFSMHATGRRGGAADLIPFTQMTLKQADAYVESLHADGGTEMLQPLSAAARLLSGVRRDKVIVLLTDGQVGNEQQIVDEIAKQAAGARVYTFGIGTNVSDVLLRGLAKRTKGAVELIHPGERIDEKVTAQFARATAARVDNVTLKWVGADAGEVAPIDPPALVDGEPWSVYGRYEAPGLGRVEIRGTLGGENFFMDVPLDLVARADRPTLTSLWAGARVKDLEEMDTSAMGRRAESHRKRIIDLCVRFGIASKLASFVVVEKRTGDRRSQGMPETRAVPVNAPAGWEMTAHVRPQDMGGRNVNMTRSGRASPGGVMRAMARSAPMPSSASFAAPPPMAAPSGGARPKMDLKAKLGKSGGGMPPVPASPSYGAPQGGFGPPPSALEGYGPPPAPGFAPPPPPPGYPASPAQAAPSGSIPMPKAPAPSSASRAAPAAKAESTKGGGGLFERAKRALGLSKESQSEQDDLSMYASRSMPAERMDRAVDDMADGALAAPEYDLGELEAEAEEKPAKAPARAAVEEIGAMFARQLASGLWESGDTSDTGRLLATTACLERCVREGIDTSNPVYGAQVTKAVDALSTLAETFATKGEGDVGVVRALLVMVAVSTGKRARGRVATIAGAAKSAVVKGIAADLVSQEAAKKRIG